MHASVSELVLWTSNAWFTMSQNHPLLLSQNTSSCIQTLLTTWNDTFYSYSLWHLHTDTFQKHYEITTLTLHSPTNTTKILFRQCHRQYDTWVNYLFMQIFMLYLYNYYCYYHYNETKLQTMTLMATVIMQCV